MGKKKNGNAPNKVVKHRNLKKTKTQKRNKDKEDEIRKMLNSQIDLIGTSLKNFLSKARLKARSEASRQNISFFSFRREALLRAFSFASLSHF